MRGDFVRIEPQRKIPRSCYDLTFIVDAETSTIIAPYKQKSRSDDTGNEGSRDFRQKSKVIGHGVIKVDTAEITLSAGDIAQGEWQDGTYTLRAELANQWCLFLLVVSPLWYFFLMPTLAYKKLYC